MLFIWELSFFICLLFLPVHLLAGNISTCSWFEDGNKWFINSPNLNKAHNGGLLVWQGRREWQRYTNTDLPSCCLPVTYRIPAMSWDSNRSLVFNSLEILAGPVLPFRSWGDTFSGVCLGNRVSFLYLDFRKGIAEEQRALSFPIPVRMQ